MNRLALSSGLVVALLSCLHASEALACGATAVPWYTPDSFAPRGAAVPLDAPLVLTFVTTPSDSDVAAPPPELTLNVVGSDDHVRLRSRQGALGATLSFVPTQDLLPNTEYRATFETGQTLGETTAPEPAFVTWQFTTGDASEPPLRLEGGLSVTLEEGEEPVYTCQNKCGDCPQTGTHRAMQARVSLPRVTGGFGEELTYVVLLTDDTPGSFARPSKPATPEQTHVVRLEQQLQLAPDTESELRFSLPEEADAYHPCFALQVSDARGDTVESEPLCLDETFAGTGRPTALDASEDDGAAGCQLGGSSRGSASILLLTLVGLAAVTRRRKPKTAP